MNANEFFLNRAGVAKPEFRRNDATVTLGGPLPPRPHVLLRRRRSGSGFRSGYASNANAATGLPTGLDRRARRRRRSPRVANEWMRTGAAGRSARSRRTS